MQENWKDFIRSTILDAIQYSGNKEPGKKKFSASMTGNTTLMNYLFYKNGSTDSNKIDVSEMGSVGHIGTEIIFGKKENCSVEYPLKEYTLSNGWIITGTADLLIHDLEQGVDWKWSTSTTISKAKKEGKYNGYSIQQAVYRFLYYKETGKLYKMGLGIWDKGNSHFKDNKNEVLELIQLDLMSIEEIEDLLLRKTNELQEYIDLDQEPAECNSEEKWLYRRKGKPTRPMRCLYYCSQAANCKHLSDRSTIANILDL